MTLGELMSLLDGVPMSHADDPVLTRSPSGWLELTDISIEPERIVMEWGPVTP